VNAPTTRPTSLGVSPRYLEYKNGREGYDEKVRERVKSGMIFRQGYITR